MSEDEDIPGFFREIEIKCSLPSERCEAILNTLVESFFLDGRELQEIHNINARKIIYVLLNCSLKVSEVVICDYQQVNYDECFKLRDYYDFSPILEVPYRELSKITKDDEMVIDLQLKKILKSSVKLEIQTLFISPEDNWREKTRERLSSGVVNNQGNVYPTNLPAYNVDGLYFRSKTEIKIYQALKKRNLLFFPLPVAIKNQFRKEPDFLISHKGKFIILEINGEEYHDLKRDNRRNDIFKLSGIMLECRAANECYEKPDEVIQQVIDILDALT